MCDAHFSSGPGGETKVPNNTYKSVRLLGDGYNLYYSVWCNNEHELYDLSVRQTISNDLERVLTTHRVIPIN